jgi:hypothetical protein
LSEATDQELKNGIGNLEKNIDKTTPNSCARIAFEVLKDKRVRDAMIELLKQDYMFDYLNCEPFGILHTKVTFMFKCKPPLICFIRPGVEVTYDYLHGKVVDVRIIYL